MLDFLLTLPRLQKRLVSLLVDLVALSLAFVLAVSLHNQVLTTVPEWHLLSGFLISLPLSLLVFVRLGLYHAVVRHMGQAALLAMVKGVLFSTLALYLGLWLFSAAISSAMVLNYALLVLMFSGGSRLIIWLLVYERKSRRKQKVLIYGAGASGRQLALALINGAEFQPLAFVDDDASLHGATIKGLSVYHPERIAALVAEERIQRILLAVPSASRSRRREILEQLEPLPVHVLSIPGMAELVAGQMKIDELQDVRIEDLLGRDTVAPHPQLLEANIHAKVVMVTGAGGSIGSELCRQILRCRPQQLVLLELSEFCLYRIERELQELCRHEGIQVPVTPLLGSVQNQSRLLAALQAFGVQTIYHAAAYKHVPLVEYNVIEGVRNNLFGSWNTAEAAIQAGVETFVLISTDKAVRPTNVMGTTKRLAELCLQGLARRQSATRFCMVRFGNVLGSSGSVVPLFREQICRGGPVTVTHKDITRYFMTIPEAAQLVLQAGAMGKGGDVFVLDMGEPIKIVDLARKMVHLMGRELKDESHPQGDIEIHYSGLRPGEKLYEELLIGESEQPTEHPRIKTANEVFLEWDDMALLLERLDHACSAGQHEQIRSLLLEAPTGFAPTDGIGDLVWLSGVRS